MNSLVRTSGSARVGAGPRTLFSVQVVLTAVSKAPVAVGGRPSRAGSEGGHGPGFGQPSESCAATLLGQRRPCPKAPSRHWNFLRGPGARQIRAVTATTAMAGRCPREAHMFRLDDQHEASWEVWNLPEMGSRGMKLGHWGRARGGTLGSWPLSSVSLYFLAALRRTGPLCHMLLPFGLKSPKPRAKVNLSSL